MASSIASLAEAGFMGALALEYDTVLGLPWGDKGGGGGGTIMGAGGGCGNGAKTGEGEVQVKEGGEGEGEGEGGGSALLSSSEAFLNFSTSCAAIDLVWRHKGVSQR